MDQLTTQESFKPNQARLTYIMTQSDLWTHPGSHTSPGHTKTSSDKPLNQQPTQWAINRSNNDLSLFRLSRNCIWRPREILHALEGSYSFKARKLKQMITRIKPKLHFPYLDAFGTLLYQRSYSFGTRLEKASRRKIMRSFITKLSDTKAPCTFLIFPRRDQSYD